MIRLHPMTMLLALLMLMGTAEAGTVSGGDPPWLPPFNPDATQRSSIDMACGKQAQAERQACEHNVWLYMHRQQHLPEIKR